MQELIYRVVKDSVCIILFQIGNHSIRILQFYTKSWNMSLELDFMIFLVNGYPKHYYLDIFSLLNSTLFYREMRNEKQNFWLITEVNKQNISS